MDLRDNATDDQIAGLQRQFGITLRYNSVHSVKRKLMIGTVDPAQRDAVIQALRAHPLVEAAEPQFVYHLQNRTFVPNDPDYPKQWHLKMIGMEDAWVRTKGAGASVAVIDSGIGTIQNNAYLQGKDFTSTKFRKGWDFVENKDIPEDENEHGTHVAGTIAESTNNGILGAGVAPEAELMPLRVADAQGRCPSGAIADALHYLADHPTDVANMSLGSHAYSQILENAMKEAYSKNVVLVCAAGNEGEGELSYPARYQECISVGAVGPRGVTAPYSNWGTGLDLVAPGGDQSLGPDAGVWQNTIRPTRGFLGLPGRKEDGFFALQGTSMATPHVTGVAALLASLGVKDPKEVRAILRRTAQSSQGRSAEHYGAGLLNAAKAVESISRATRTDYLKWGLSAAGILLVIVLGSNLRRPTDPMFFAHKVAIAGAAGVAAPLLIEKLAGFGSLWNLAGHGIVLALLFLWAPPIDRSGVWQAGAFATGLLIHLALDADSLRVPFQVFPTWRIEAWLYANIAVGVLFLISTALSRRKAFRPAYR